MNEMPRVGAKIRVARTYVGGTVIAIEGIVVAFDLDRFERVTCIHLADGMSVSLENDTKSTVTWVELESPKPALPPEPAVGGLVMVTAAGDDSLVFRRRSASDDHDYALLDLHGGDWFRWADVCSLGTPVLLVPAPDLAELVAALRKLVVLLHNDHLRDDDFEQCEEHHCELRALLAKHGGAAT